jgi:hypothetical protein
MTPDTLGLCLSLSDLHRILSQNYLCLKINDTRCDTARHEKGASGWGAVQTT